MPTKDSAVDLSDLDEIFQQSVELYSVNESARDSQTRGPFDGFVGSFVKFPFTLQLSDECSKTVAGDIGTAKVPLPPSLQQKWQAVYVRQSLTIYQGRPRD